jgi:hypothetical protein
MLQTIFEKTYLGKNMQESSTSFTVTVAVSETKLFKKMLFKTKKVQLFLKSSFYIQILVKLKSVQRLVTVYPLFHSMYRSVNH